MKARSKRMQIVVDMAKRDEENAITVFQQAQKSLAAEQQKLADLDQYYASYEDYFSDHQQSLRASDLQKSRLFLQQLSEAKKSQQTQLKKIEKLVEDKRGLWHASHLKHKSLLDWVARIEQQELLVLNNKEQQQVDEWVNQRSSDSQSN